MEPEQNFSTLQSQINSAFAQSGGEVSRTSLAIIRPGYGCGIHARTEPPNLYTLELHGRLLRPSAEVFPRWLAGFNRRGFTPFLRQDESAPVTGGGQNVVLQVLTGVVPHTQIKSWINLALFVVTVLSTLAVGALYSFSGFPPDLSYWQAFLDGFDDAADFDSRMDFFCCSLSILTAHEFRHYFAARYHKVAVTLPYFIPLPMDLAPWARSFA